MFRLAWCTDTHFNFLRLPASLGAALDGVREDVKDLSGDDLDALLITGDVAEGHDFAGHLKKAEEYLGKPVYFVLGNHDMYSTSIEKAKERASRLPGWLSNKVVSLSETVALTGNEGWYDAQIGNPYNLKMADFYNIQEFNRKTVEGIIQVSREVARKSAEKARVMLNQALDTHEKVIFATHFPPFERACWHMGRLSDVDFLPWFTSKAMGDVLVEVALERPDKKILVLCGHTHSSGSYSPLDNLKVLTGQAQYYYPQIAGIVEVGDQGISVDLKSGNIFLGLPNLV